MKTDNISNPYDLVNTYVAIFFLSVTIYPNS